MLIYNQAYDLFHTMFRILQITEKNKDILEIDKLGILDFYLAFPSELLEIKVFKVSRNTKNIYRQKRINMKE